MAVGNISYSNNMCMFKNIIFSKAQSFSQVTLTNTAQPKSLLQQANFISQSNSIPQLNSSSFPPLKVKPMAAQYCGLKKS